LKRKTSVQLHGAMVLSLANRNARKINTASQKKAATENKEWITITLAKDNTNISSF
jgi:hypothetical protein